MKSIWSKELKIDELNKRNNNTLATHLGIKCTKLGPDYLEGEMMVTENHLQPGGIMNGGASCVFAETIASTAANYCIDGSDLVCVGQSISTNHIRPAKLEKLRAIAKPIHLGRSSQVWEIKVYNALNKIISLTTLTLAIIKK